MARQAQLPFITYDKLLLGYMFRPYI